MRKRTAILLSQNEAHEGRPQPAVQPQPSTAHDQAGASHRCRVGGCQNALHTCGMPLLSIPAGRSFLGQGRCSLPRGCCSHTTGTAATTSGQTWRRWRPTRRRESGGRSASYCSGSSRQRSRGSGGARRPNSPTRTGPGDSERARPRAPCAALLPRQPAPVHQDVQDAGGAAGEQVADDQPQEGWP
jgi:hypothetical protein